MPELLEALRGLLDYDPDTGIFAWRVARNSFGGGVKPGDFAGSMTDQGYVQIIVDQRRYRAHRLAWLFMTGSFPPDGHEIDHINGIRSDNRRNNLRLATRSENNMNAGLRTNNRSGHRGVSWVGTRKQWTARITIGGRVRCLGNFDHIDDAVRARTESERRLFAGRSYLERAR